MTKEKTQQAFTFYKDFLDRLLPGPAKQLAAGESGQTFTAVAASSMIAHLKFMCVSAPTFTDNTKVMRWLGFLQGVLWARGFFTLEELKGHSRE